MDLLPVRSGFVLESMVMLFQFLGVGSLLYSRLLPTHRGQRRGKWLLVLAMVGLGVAGGICAHHRSSMGLCAGGTMTFLLVGMIVGKHPLSSGDQGVAIDTRSSTGLV